VWPLRREIAAHGKQAIGLRQLYRRKDEFVVEDEKRHAGD